MTSSRKAHEPRSRTSADPKQSGLAQLVREKLHALGDFDHLVVYQKGDHIVVAIREATDQPTEQFPVLRLSPIGRFQFGLSLYRHTGRWQKLPITGAVADVLRDAVQMLGPYLERDPNITRTYEMDH